MVCLELFDYCLRLGGFFLELFNLYCLKLGYVGKVYFNLNYFY